MRSVNNLVELADGRELVGPQEAHADFGAEIVFSPDRGARQAAEHGDLTDVRERVGNRALEEPRGRRSQREAGAEIGVQCLEGGVETPNFLFSGKRLRIVPSLVPL
jgi:hypothetical protein